MPLQIEMMRRTVRLPGHPFRTCFFMRLHSERQQQERAEGEEQEIDGDDRSELHAATCNNITSTRGFFPVHSVAQRRTASRTASRIRSTSPPGLMALVAASVPSA